MGYEMVDAIHQLSWSMKLIFHGPRDKHEEGKFDARRLWALTLFSSETRWMNQAREGCKDVEQGHDMIYAYATYIFLEGVCVCFCVFVWMD